MREDEAGHASMALEAGAAVYPDGLKRAMWRVASVMTRLSERI
jgi:demethoxyubiquinone hydroxylase (CLK1/Coq7/Cat5 family)